MHLKLLFLILCSPLFLTAQESKYDYTGVFFSEPYKNYQFPYSFKVVNDTLFVSDSNPASFKKAFIIRDTILTDSTGKELWKLEANHFINIEKGEYSYYEIINSYMIEYSYPRQYFFMHDVAFMGHIGPDYPDGVFGSSPAAEGYSPLKQKMQRLAILVYLAELVKSKGDIVTAIEKIK